MSSIKLSIAVVKKTQLKLCRSFVWLVFRAIGKFYERFWVAFVKCCILFLVYLKTHALAYIMVSTNVLCWSEVDWGDSFRDINTDFICKVILQTENNAVTRVIQKVSSVCEYCHCSAAVTMVRMRAEIFDSLSRHGHNLQKFEQCLCIVLCVYNV